MARQERTARASKRAAEQADTIIAEATTKARGKTARTPKLTDEQAFERRVRDSAAIRGISRERVMAERAGLVEPLKRCPVCGATGTVPELKAGGHGKRCTNAPQTDAKARKGAAATAKVVRKPEGHSVDLGARCVEMREQGASWMAIGAALGLPGAKTGAAAARKLYAAHTGQSHTTAPSPARKPRASKRHAATVGSKVSRREVVQQRGGFFSADTTDNEIISLVHGKTVEWSIDLARLAGGKGAPEWCDQEARVHPTDVYVREDNGERVLNFRTLEGHYEDGKPIAGPTRTVRLAAIHTVR